MWRFQRVDQHAVYDCELFLLWFIPDPDGEREDDWNIWEIYDSDGLYLLEYYAWWGCWDIWDKNHTLPGQSWGSRSEQYIAKARDHVRLFRCTMQWLHESRELLDFLQGYIKQVSALLADRAVIKSWSPWRDLSYYSTNGETTA